MVEKMSLLHRAQRLVALVAEQAFVRDLAADSTALLRMGKRNTRFQLVLCNAYFYATNILTFNGSRINGL